MFRLRTGFVAVGLRLVYDCHGIPLPVDAGCGGWSDRDWSSLTLSVFDVDVLVDGQLEAVSNGAGQWLIAVAAQRAEDVQKPFAVGFVVAEQGQEPADRADAGWILFARAHPASECGAALRLGLR